MDQSASSRLVFTVKRHEPELIVPAKPTPREFKLLSDIDDQDGLRFQVPVIYFYPHQPSMAGKDPAHLIRNALAQTLVFYYPFAGRLREGSARKLMVDCNGEGVIFIEADADVTLHQFVSTNTLQPPFPCFQELLYNVPGSDGIIDCPLLLVQVTRLKCGGFIFAFRINHTMSDAPGIAQFLNALAEIAHGASEPSIPPVWRRELLNARDSPCITHTHFEYEEAADDEDTEESEDMAHRSFFFGPSEIAAIRQLVPFEVGPFSTFEVLFAFLWRCRTKALEIESQKKVRAACLGNLRGKSKSNCPLLPVGYYGNAFVYPAAVTTAGELCANSLGYALELVKKVKSEMTVEYAQSVADLMVTRGRPCFNRVRSWIVSNVNHTGLKDVDLGWGKAVFGGPAKAGGGDFPGISFFIPYENAKGEEGLIIPICLPQKAMKRFAKELDRTLTRKKDTQHPRIIRSLL